MVATSQRVQQRNVALSTVVMSVLSNTAGINHQINLNNLIQIYNQFRFETMNRHQLTLEWLHSPFFWVHERIGAVGPTTVWAQCRNFFLARPHLPSPPPPSTKYYKSNGKIMQSETKKTWNVPWAVAFKVKICIIE